MFFETPVNIDFAGYADDNTSYTYSSNIKNVLDNLQGALKKTFRWFLKITWQQMQENITFSQALKHPQIYIFLILRF